MTLKWIKKIIATVILVLFNTKTSQAFGDINVKIDNKNNSSIRYTIYNYKYTEEDVIWKFLAANAGTFASIPYTTKYGYFELRIDAEGQQLSYIPSGNHLDVTVRVEDDSVVAKTIKLSRLIGIK